MNSRKTIPLSIALRFRVLLALFGVLAAGFTGYYAYSASRTLLVQAAENQLLTATQVLGRRITVMLDSTARDVQLVASHPQTARLLAATDDSLSNGSVATGSVANDSDALATLFTQLLSVHPEYFQIRLIAAASHGMERVRIDRDHNRLLRIRGDELQEKGHYPYVFETLRLPRDWVHVSRVVINHERGAHAGEGRPALQLAAPVYGDDALGLVVINVDLASMFALLAADLPHDFGLYLANQQGDFLIHPDPSKAFAFDQGRRERVQEQFAATAALIDGTPDHIVTVTAPDAAGERAVAAFIRQPQLVTPAEGAFFIIGLSQPLQNILRESDALGMSTLQIVIAFSLLSIVLATILTRAITKPLDQMVQAVRRFAEDHTCEPMPVTRRDEIGVLARSFADMQQQIASQLSTLHNNQRELDHLAGHDSLTSLPNRRLFMERLEHALAHARRGGEHPALLYIDIDHFKDINDSLGHAAGDKVLRTAAQRIFAVVREVDTVARLGGDEFIVLLDNARSANITSIAQKILDALAPSIAYESHTLQIGASIGISQYPQDGVTSTELVASADRAMYQAKNAGRNRFCFSAVP